ncbi:MAG TPA: alpha-isopropylmalate synthase regulatory domain-containing protein [Kofleriaceae bacterium]|nr:alpha-isopropylmalate synthase regulatory domain-containing protein [Kofleriaceae bacterium]
MNGPDDNIELIRRILGQGYLELRLTRLSTEEVPELAAKVAVEVSENGAPATIEGDGVGPIDALWGALVGRYAREYQSLKSLQLAGFTVSAAIESKRRKAGLDALARVELAVNNSEGKRFTFHDESRSVTVSAARAVIAIAEYFVNAERAFVTLFNARKDALARGRPDLVARYTAELAEVVKSTSYAEVIESLRKELTPP